MNVVSVAIDAAWLLLAAYGLRVQLQAIGFARRNWRVARMLPMNGVLVMAQARLRSNTARLSIICTNAAIGVVAMITTLAVNGPPAHYPAWVIAINTLIALGFTCNEVVMVVIARLEVGAHRHLVEHALEPM